MRKIPNTDWQGNEFSDAGNYIPLQPLKTEDVAYARVCLVAPVGGGISFKASPSLNFGLEASYSATTTDYLDDVSTTCRLHESFTDPLAQAMAEFNFSSKYRMDLHFFFKPNFSRLPT